MLTAMIGDVDKLLEKANQQKEKPTRSVLEPYYEVIATLRRKNWTFEDIAEFFKSEGVEVSGVWINQFWLRRHGPKNQSRPKKAHELKASARTSQSSETSTIKIPLASDPPPAEAKKPFVHQGDLTDEERKELRQLKANTGSNKTKIWSD